MTGVEIRI